MLRVARFNGNLESIAARVVDGLRQLGEGSDPGASTRLVGPLRIYSAGEYSLEQGFALRTLKPTGWRGLVLSDEKPVACVDLLQRERKRDLAVSVRGREAAAALFSVLKFAERWSGRRNYQLRFVTMPRLFVTALWLHGENSIFVPTRTGLGARPRPEAYSLVAFRDLVRTRLRATSSARSNNMTALSLEEEASPSNDPPRIRN